MQAGILRKVLIWVWPGSIGLRPYSFKWRAEIRRMTQFFGLYRQGGLKLIGRYPVESTNLLRATCPAGETGKTAMMARHDRLFYRFLQGCSSIVFVRIVDQRAGVDAALAVGFDNHFTEITHKALTLISVEVLCHTGFGNLGDLGTRSGGKKVRKFDNGNVFCDSDS